MDLFLSEVADQFVLVSSVAEKEVRSLEEELQIIRYILDNAENQRFMDKKINCELFKLEQMSYEIEDVLDEWNYASLKHQISVDSLSNHKVCFFIPSSLCLWANYFPIRHNIANKLLKLKAQLAEVLAKRRQYNFVRYQPIVYPLPGSFRVESTPMADLANVHGRDSDRDILVSKLIDNSGRLEQSGIPVLSIVGAAGVGKTTLAQLVYNHSQVEEYFEVMSWVCVSDPFDLVKIGKGILESIKIGSSQNISYVNELFKLVEESILGKRLLLVLDDVWTNDDKLRSLEYSLRCSGAGSKILVTTRNERVSSYLRESEIYRLRLLSDDDCWLLLWRMAHLGRSDVGFKELGKKIAKKCNGLPLAAVALGNHLRFKNSLEEWENVFEGEIWNMKEAEVDIFPHLLLSYNKLSIMSKRCFSYCAFFPKDTKIVIKNLKENWMALDYLGSNDDNLEIRAKECFDNLVRFSLLELFEEDDCKEIQNCKMQDIVHDFAQFLRKSGRVPGMNRSKTCRVCNSSQEYILNEPRSLFCITETPPTFCECFVPLRVLSLTDHELKSVPRGMEKLIHLRWLNLTGITKIYRRDLKIIFQLYRLQTLSLKDCDLREIPRQIRNLIHLRCLNLSLNRCLKELPKEIGKLIQLRSLDLSGNEAMMELPIEMENLIHLKYLDLNGNESLEKIPDSIYGLPELQTLNSVGCRSVCRLFVRLNSDQLSGRWENEFRGGNDWKKLTSLDHLDRVLWLKIRLDGDFELANVVEDAQAADLKNKTHIEEFQVYFEESSSSSVQMDVLDALQPHPNLSELSFWRYRGSELPKWMLSPLNQVRSVYLNFCNHLTSLPALGKLPCVEKICIYQMAALETVGQEFLGITTGDGGVDVIAFPKLKKLEIRDCYKWKTWEDITVEEESAASSVMPCLTELTITGCNGLIVLPHCLLRKASSLENLRISGSTELVRRYETKDGSDWKSLSINNPRLRIYIHDEIS